MDASPVPRSPTRPPRRWSRSDAAQSDGDTWAGWSGDRLRAAGRDRSYVHSDRRLTPVGRRADGIQAMKGVEIGDGFRTARRRGSAAHDEMVPGEPVRRLTNRPADRGRMTNGEPVRVRVAMKPISTVPGRCRTVDVATASRPGHPPAVDVCAGAAAGVARGHGRTRAGRRGAGEVRRRPLAETRAPALYLDARTAERSRRAGRPGEPYALRRPRLRVSGGRAGIRSELRRRSRRRVAAVLVGSR